MPCKKIVFIGVESSGKTTLARALAEKLQGTYIPEYARVYLDANGLTYKQADLLAIAKGQIQLYQEVQSKEQNWLLCDTDLLVIKVWSEQVFGSCDEWIIQQIKLLQPDLYILCTPDIAWEYDPQRTMPILKDRIALHQHYKALLEQLACEFITVKGSLENRIQQVTAALGNWE
ncbi:MAG: ATP-binding protein [Chitinophagaceae bacterium]|nr:ATP-binding protein [Chitinophagaceae bacterium]